VGVFDENYFMYVEEADYCCRLREKGGSVYYYPKACIVHLLGQSTKQDFKQGDWIANPFLIERYKSMLYFFKKHYHRIQLYLLKLIIIEGHLLKLGVNLLKWLFCAKKREELEKIIGIYSAIIKLAINYK
jgi:GT2 family glycosyltransferase